MVFVMPLCGLGDAPMIIRDAEGGEYGGREVGGDQKQEKNVVQKP